MRTWKVSRPSGFSENVACAKCRSPLGINTKQDTVCLVNWYGRPDFRPHVYTRFRRRPSREKAAPKPKPKADRDNDSYTHADAQQA